MPEPPSEASPGAGGTDRPPAEARSPALPSVYPSGRPLSGVLGALFKVIGEGDVKWARAGISEDGIQVVRAQAKKLFTKTATVTVLPDGVAEKDVPDDRPDLAAIAARLEADLDLEYYPYRCW